jgi:ribonuclease J
MQKQSQPFPKRQHGGNSYSHSVSSGYKGNPKPSPVYNPLKEKVTLNIPEIRDGVRIIPLGGVEGIGSNMTAIETKEDIFIIDAGFSFKDESAPGVDYILPNTKYLEERKHKIRGLLITHGHLDHIGAIPYIMQGLGNPPIYTRLFTAVFIKKRQEEFPQLPALDIRVVEKTDTITIGSLQVSFFAVTHTVPDAMGIIIHTPYGAIVHSGDNKLEHENGVVVDSEKKEYEKFKNLSVLCLMSDSTNTERPGFSVPESLVIKTITAIIHNTRGRIILGAFASQLERLMTILEVAVASGRMIIIDGRSLKSNFEIVHQLGMLKIPRESMATMEEMHRYPPERLLILATGAQGDQYASLMRAANATHRNLKIIKGDTVVLSSSIIPGNEKSVQKLKDGLSKRGAKIIHYQTSDVHSSGHANGDEMQWIISQIKPKFFIPEHGYHYMLVANGEVAIRAGVERSNVVIPDNGMIIDIVENGTKVVIQKEKAPSAKVMVDGTSVSDVQDVVIKDRQMLAEDGMFVIVAVVDGATGQLRKSPDIISRGFVYLKESQELLRHARTIIKKTIEDVTTKQHPNGIDVDYLKQTVTDTVTRFLLQKTAKRPVVIPVILSL